MGAGDYGPTGDYPSWQGNGGQQYGQPGVPPQYQQQPQFTPQPQYQQPYPPQGYYPPQQQPPRKSRKGIGCGSVAALFIIIAVVAGANSHSSSSSSSSAPAAVPVPSLLQTLATVPVQSAIPVQAAAPAKPAAPQTVTYAVSGSPADVTYGPAGTNVSGTVPLRVTGPLGSPLYYAITAQLQGGGSVSCQILVDGQVISSAVATGGYNIAQCEIGQNPLSGKWEDDN